MPREGKAGTIFKVIKESQAFHHHFQETRNTTLGHIHVVRGVRVAIVIVKLHDHVQEGLLR
jgi:hypothetical protein